MATVLKPHHHWFFLQSNDFAWTMPVCCIKDCIFLLYIKHHSGITYRLVPPDPSLKVVLLLLVTNSSWWCPNQSVRVAVRPTLLMRQLCDLVQHHHHRHCHQLIPINCLSEWACLLFKCTPSITDSITITFFIFTKQDNLTFLKGCFWSLCTAAASAASPASTSSCSSNVLCSMILIRFLLP